MCSIRIPTKHVRLLLSKDPNKIVPGASGTPLTLFARDKSFDMAALFAREYKDVHINFDTVDQFGMTALMCAADCGSEKNALVLLRYPQNLGLRDNEGCNALYYAISRKHWELAKGLIAKMNLPDLGANLLSMLLSSGQYAIAEEFVDRFEVAADEDIRPALTQILELEFEQGEFNMAIVSWLLEHGANPDCTVKGQRLIDHCNGDEALVLTLSHYGIVA